MDVCILMDLFIQPQAIGMALMGGFSPKWVSTAIIGLDRLMPISGTAWFSAMVT